MKILVTGGNGQVGRAMVRAASTGHDVTSLTRSDCDLSSEASIRAAVRRVRADVIVNAAAYTAVDRAETERDLCYQVNAVAPGILAEEATELGALLIHYSTDYVFDGTKPGASVEEDPIAPLNVYGASKAAGEHAVLRAGGRALILRTSWVYDADGKNFLTTMLRLGKERPELRVVDDQVGAPTSADVIAEATVRVMQSISSGRAKLPDVYHMTAMGSTSWCGFARAIFARAGVPVRVVPITTSEYPTPAARPQNSVLSNEKFMRSFQFALPSWEAQLQDVLASMQKQTAPAAALR